jgi:polysaccharide export outer membrane protein
VNAKAAFILVAGTLALLAGCAEPPAEPAAALPESFLKENHPPQEVPEAKIVRRDYRLRSGDSLEIIYHIRHFRNPSYRIKIQDVINLRFPFNPSLNQTETVQSDGTLHLDLVGAVYVFDRTIEEVKEELTERYGKYLKDPSITVSFDASNVKIAELKQSILTAPRGQSRLVPIGPDGRISLPFIVDILAAGKTIGQMHRDLNEAYRAIGLDELEVTVNVQSFAPVQVFVLGEVRIPGALLNRTGAVASNAQLTLLQAIAQAGGYLPGRAELSKVMLVRRNNLPRPEVAIINVFQLLENRNKAVNEPVTADSQVHRYDIWLEDGDFVYVPTTEIAKRADYIDLVWTRGIRAVGGFSTSANANYSASDAVDWLGPNP